MNTPKDTMSGHRMRARGIIVAQDHVLTIKRTKPDQVYWVFPGGGVEEGETPEQAVVRECQEELGVDVKVGDLFVEEISGHPQTMGQPERYYFSEITGGVLGNAFGPEYQFGTHYVGKYELVWIKTTDLMTIDLRPNTVRDLLYKHYTK